MIIFHFLQEDDLPELPNGVPETESPDGKKKRKIAEDFLNEPKAPLEETWEPLEPHEVVTIAKPIRKGKFFIVSTEFNKNISD